MKKWSAGLASAFLASGFGAALASGFASVFGAALAAGFASVLVSAFGAPLAAGLAFALAAVAFQYGEAMGVTYPVHTTVTPPGEPVRVGSSALSYAADAHRRALAAAVHSDPSTVSRQVAALVRAGLIERQADPEDGRASVLVPTPVAPPMSTTITARCRQGMPRTSIMPAPMATMTSAVPRSGSTTTSASGTSSNAIGRT